MYKNDAVVYANNIKAQRTHVQKHPSNVQQGREEEQASPPENRRHEKEHQLLHWIGLLRGGGGGGGTAAPSQAAVPMHWIQKRDEESVILRSRRETQLRLNHITRLGLVWWIWTPNGEESVVLIDSIDGGGEDEDWRGKNDK